MLAKQYGGWRGGGKKKLATAFFFSFPLFLLFFFSFLKQLTLHLHAFST